MSSVLIFVFSGWVLANVWTNMVGFVLFALIFMPHLFAKSCIILVAFCSLRSIVLRFLLAHHTVMSSANNAKWILSSRSLFATSFMYRTKSRALKQPTCGRPAFMLWLDDSFTKCTEERYGPVRLELEMALSSSVFEIGVSTFSSELSVEFGNASADFVCVFSLFQNCFSLGFESIRVANVEFHFSCLRRRVTFLNEIFQNVTVKYDLTNPVFILLLLQLLLLATLARRTFIVSVFVVPFNIDA
ncbi:hypothetical protein BpHYR1_026623 [Brachionus plicatilis]|uniref:Uncharacterized protein n=1 Tax=Brachionus plicatilis TaxID=10195 RepID=A0A3M7QGB6_BRAPC|nr:hypothetical protein BpHYR1_026623 [Brachionus plicatilis]